MTPMMLLLAFVIALGGQARTPDARGVENRGPRDAERWRYVNYAGHWWHWSRAERWSYHDGSRWIDLDLMGQPLRASDRPAAHTGDRRTARGRRGGPSLPRGFGVLAPPASRAGDFGDRGGPAMARAFAGGFAGETDGLPVGDFGAGGQVRPPTNPYGPDSEYGAYGSTDPFRGGLHLGGGGNFGYGLGTRAVPAGGSAADNGNVSRSIPSAPLGRYGQPTSAGRL